MYERLFFDFDICIMYFIIGITTFYCTAFLFYKLQTKKVSKSKLLIIMVTGMLISVIYSLLNIIDIQLCQVFLNSSIVLLLAILAQDRFVNQLVIALVSLSVFLIFKTFSMLTIAVVFWLIGYVHKNLIVYTIDMVMASILCFLFARIKRIRRGLPFFQNEKFYGLGVIVSGIIILLNSFSLKNNNTNSLFIIIIFGGLIVGFGLYLWIRRSITAHYRERLQLKAEEHFQSLLQEKEIENQKLNQTNEYLAKVVHRDNHLMSALDTSIKAYFESDNEQDKDDLLREIQTLAKERGELIEKEQRDSKLLPTTGNLLIDGAINDLFIKAASHGIDFSLTVAEPISAIIGKYISQTDLQTLLCDHIKDAIIAVDATENDKGKIMVDFSVKNENYQITVFDSGVDFEIDTLAKLGKERVTTHADNGGSGIGFMTTFETLRKSYASLIITEFKNKIPFSKSVAICFDGESEYIIQSYRAEQLKAGINREDVVIL